MQLWMLLSGPVKPDLPITALLVPVSLCLPFSLLSQRLGWLDLGLAQFALSQVLCLAVFTSAFCGANKGQPGVTL